MTKKLFHSHSSLYVPKWKKLARVFGALQPVDRTGLTKDFGFDYSIIDPIPVDPYTELTFEEICDARAFELVNNTKPIMVMYSGGIDSTVVFSSLLKTGKEFTVGYTASTLREYPWLCNKLKAKHWPQVHFKYIANIPFNKLQKDYLVITGVIGDQIVGTVKHFIGEASVPDAIRPGQLKPYEDVLTNYLLTTFEPQINAAPIKLNDFADYLWWMNFVFKYQWVCLQFITVVDMDINLPIVHFFNTTLFQQWAMSNREMNKEFIVANNPALYKNEFKKYIFSILNDESYFKEKTKVGSLTTKTFHVFNPDLLIADNNGAMEAISLKQYNEL